MFYIPCNNEVMKLNFIKIVGTYIIWIKFLQVKHNDNSIKIEFILRCLLKLVFVIKNSKWPSILKPQKIMINWYAGNRISFTFHDLLNCHSLKCWNMLSLGIIKPNSHSYCFTNRLSLWKMQQNKINCNKVVFYYYFYVLIRRK